MKEMLEMLLAVSDSENTYWVRLLLNIISNTKYEST